MLTIPDDLANRIHVIAEKTGQTDINVIESLLVEYEQDQLDAQEAADAYRAFQDSGEKAMTLEQLRQQNGL